GKGASPLKPEEVRQPLIRGFGGAWSAGKPEGFPFCALHEVESKAAPPRAPKTVESKETYL
ncbi:hypothetical protein ACTHS7_12435, partial [Neisseria sp. P0015.S009]|uniref:hypothetical protein n=1 Tax=Neisseria sp. P0015.S009 TaxID=3436765 RepID=UPI003F7EB5E4